MFFQEGLLEYLSSPEAINKLIFGIIVVGDLNVIFKTYRVRSIYGALKKEREKLKVQHAKIDKLSPK